MVDLKIQLSDSFFNEEVSCGFTITNTTKEIWAVLLDLLAEFDRVCRKHNIKYVACGGTLLGAVRHNGFIPWDDDIDVAMLRSEYEKLCEIAPTEFKHPYFWQTAYTDKGYLKGHAQLRNSMTTAIIATDFRRKRPFNQGIFIDVFPLDDVPSSVFVYKMNGYASAFFRKVSVFFSNIFVRYWEYDVSWRTRLVKLTTPINSKLSIAFFKLYEWILKSQDGKRTKEVSHLSFDYFNHHFFRAKMGLNDLKDHSFENLTILIPSDYDLVLKKQYGDYLTPVKGGSLHGGVIFDVNRPYSYYLNMNKEETESFITEWIHKDNLL